MRPTKYKPEYCDQIIEFMTNGAAIVEFAAYIGVEEKTIYNWADQHPEFLQSKNMAMAKCQAWWARLGRDSIMNEYQGNNLNTSNWIFNMKARFRWTDQEKPQAPEENPVVDQEIHSLANTEK